jgi:hypothetical protein
MANRVNTCCCFKKTRRHFIWPLHASPSSDSNEVVIDADLDFTPVLDGSIEPPFYMFGITTRWCNGVLIKDIKPSSTDLVSVTAELDEERVYLDDNSPAPTTTSITFPNIYF